MSNYRLKLLNEELARIVNIIIEEYKPEKIILFGSLVSGTVHEFSDIDLIVISEVSLMLKIADSKASKMLQEWRRYFGK